MTQVRRPLERRMRLLGLRTSGGQHRPERTSLATKIANAVGVLAGLATVIGVVGAIVAVLEYSGRGEAERAEATLKIVDSWEDDGYKASLENLSVGLASRLSGLPPNELKVLQGMDTAQQAPILASIGDDYIVENGAASVDELFYFFTKLTVCVSAELCSVNAVDAFFGEPVRTFWLYFSNYADRQRDLHPGFARDIEAYVARG